MGGLPRVSLDRCILGLLGICLGEDGHLLGPRRRHIEAAALPEVPGLNASLGRGRGEGGFLAGSFLRLRGVNWSCAPLLREYVEGGDPLHDLQVRREVVQADRSPRANRAPPIPVCWEGRSGAGGGQSSLVLVGLARPQRPARVARAVLILPDCSPCLPWTPRGEHYRYG